RLLRRLPLIGRGLLAQKAGAARLRPTPSTLRWRSTLAGADATRFVFRVPVADTSDATRIPALSRSRVWSNAATLGLTPLSGMQLQIDLTSLRDLRDYGDSTTLGRVARQSRRSLLGTDIGVETQRSFNSFLGVTPQLAQWMRPRLTLASTFGLTRDPNGRDPIRDAGDSGGAFR